MDYDVMFNKLVNQSSKRAWTQRVSTPIIEEVQNEDEEEAIWQRNSEEFLAKNDAYVDSNETLDAQIKNVPVLWRMYLKGLHTRHRCSPYPKKNRTHKLVSLVLYKILWAKQGAHSSLVLYKIHIARKLGI